MANALIGIQNTDNTVTSIECYGGGDLAGAGSTLYSCYSDRAKAETLVRMGAVQQLAAKIEDTGFVAEALASRRHKPTRYSNRNEYARSGASHSQYVYLAQKNGAWSVLDGLGTKGNPRWPGLKRVLGERGLRVPGITTAHDDHEDMTVIARVEALVGVSPSVPAPAPEAVHAGGRDFEEDFDEAVARAAGGGRHRPLDGKDRHRPGQRDGRILRFNAEGGVGKQTRIPNEESGEDGDLRVFGNLLQHSQAALCPWLQKPG